MNYPVASAVRFPFAVAALILAAACVLTIALGTYLRHCDLRKQRASKTDGDNA